MNTYAFEKTYVKERTSSREGESSRTPVMLITLTLAFFILLLCFPDISRKAVISSLIVCAFKLIPSLFPFMVAGELFFALGAGSALGKILGTPFEKVFGISKNGVSAFVLGAVCGLPLGGKYALSLYKNGEISKNDCERLMGISNNAGMGFVVAGIGFSIWGSKAFGWLLYICQIAASVIAGILLRGAKSAAIIAPVTPETAKRHLSVILSEAVSSSALSLIKVCAFVIFFGVLTEFTVSACAFFALPDLFSATLSAFTEISSACGLLHGFYISNAPATAQSAKILTFFAVGFSGMSAHMQLTSFASECGVKMKKYYITKLLSGLICALIGASALHFLNV